MRGFGAHQTQSAPRLVTTWMGDRLANILACSDQGAMEAVFSVTTFVSALKYFIFVYTPGN